MLNHALTEKVLMLLIQQGRPSTINGTCLYRADRTAECPIRCAAGHLIPDELYDFSMEHRPISELVRGPLAAVEEIFDNQETVIALQELHDEWRTWSSKECFAAAVHAFLIAAGMKETEECDRVAWAIDRMEWRESAPLAEPVPNHWVI